MTPEQLVALRAACFADQSAAAFFASGGDANGLRSYLNTVTATSAWRTDAPVDVILDAITFVNYTPNDAIAAGDTDPTLSRKIGWLLTVQTKQMNLQLMLQGRQTVNAAKPNVRGGLRDAVIQLPTGAGGANTSPGGANGSTVLNACVRPAKRVEVMLAKPASGSDTTGTVTARVMTFEGDVSEIESIRLIYKDTGEIWEP